MAFTIIPASETDFNSPGNETLFDKMRENFNELMRSMPLLVRGGDIGVQGNYLDSAGTWHWEMDIYKATTGEGDYNVGHYVCYIPAGITSLKVDLYGKATTSNPADVMVIDINGVEAVWGSIGAAWGWLGEIPLVPGVTGRQNVTIKICRRTAIDNWAGYIRGILIRPEV